jgi:putative endonuclease
MSGMTTTATGRKAERAATVYLEMRGFKIIEQNWRRPRCEIDIIASKGGVIHFVEVKYRFNDDQGGGLDAITASKLKQMQRAAWSWVDETKWHGEYVLSAVEIAGEDFAVIGFIENVF